MNKYPTPLNLLVLIILLTGILLALPNFYGSVPALQVADRLGDPITEARIGGFVQTLANADITPEVAFLKDDRAVLRFQSVEQQQAASERLRDRYDREFNVALTLAPDLPAWVRGLYPGDGCRPNISRRYVRYRCL